MSKLTNLIRLSITDSVVIALAARLVIAPDWAVSIALFFALLNYTHRRHTRDKRTEYSDATKHEIKRLTDKVAEMDAMIGLRKLK